MGYQLTDIGEEWLMKNNADGATLEVGVYNDTTTGASDTTDLPIATEPDNANYSRQSDTFSVADLSGNWGVDNDNQITFDFSDTTTSEELDAYFIVANFQSVEAGDGSPADHVIATGPLSQTRNAGEVDTLHISAGGCGFTVN